MGEPEGHALPREVQSIERPKDGFYPVDCRNPRDHRVIEFLLPILYPEIPKQLSITMGNMIFGALSRARLVNWGRLIQELVEKLIPYIGKKPSPLSPYLLHLYQQMGCVNKAKEDALIFLDDEVAYKLAPKVEHTEVGMEESLRDPTVLELPLAANTPDSKQKATYRTREGTFPSREPNWRDVVLSIFEYPEAPFKHTREEIDEL